MTCARKDYCTLLSFCIFLTCCWGFGERDVRYKGPEEVWEGDPFEISCILTIRDVEGWTINTTAISEDNAVGYILTERILDAFRKEVTLQARSAQLHHEGKYRCNRFSRDYHYLKVIPAFPDQGGDQEKSIPKSTNEYILQINQTVEFFCSSAKDENVPVTWFKNGARIWESSRSNFLIAGLSLIIENAQEDDAGVYMCTVDTPQVTGYTAIGRLFYLNSPPKIGDFPQKKSIIRGRSLRLVCKAKGYPVPKFTWFIGNLNATKLKETDPRISIYPEERKEEALQNTVLEIQRMSLADRGLYTCTAENSIDSGKTMEHDEESVFVHVRENIIETNEDQPGMGKVLIPGEPLMLQCNTTGCIHCIVEWFKDGERLYPIPDHLSIHEENKSITIENASYSDSGEYVCAVDFKQLNFTLKSSINIQCEQEIHDKNERVKLLEHDGLHKGKLMIEIADLHDRNRYTCEAFNQIDAVHTTIFIHVKDDMIQTNEDQPGMGKLLNPGDPLVLQCNTSDCSKCTVMWFKNGKRLHSVPGHLQIYEKNNSVVIENSSYNDSGVYVCAIDRKHLDVALNASIIVQSKIKLDKFHISDVVTEGSPLELYCNAKGAPTPLIKWFIGEQEIFDNDERIKLVEHDGLEKGKLLIEEADFDDRNHYTCEAYNQVDAVNSTIFIRVKGKLAALWPFLGICAEVAILGTIIFVYERRKSRNQCDEPDTALPAENKHRDQKGKGQDVRQRK